MLSSFACDRHCVLLCDACTATHTPSLILSSLLPVLDPLTLLLDFLLTGPDLPTLTTLHRSASAAAFLTFHNIIIARCTKLNEQNV